MVVEKLSLGLYLYLVKNISMHSPSGKSKWMFTI
uniref:Uncharacterized protein n=1 Tax=Anguilla anguilla TaxID=7936 RepID=A0A0E9R906_ANGAN